MSSVRRSLCQSKRGVLPIRIRLSGADFSALKESEMKAQELTLLAAYKRTPALDNSTWYKGILVSQMAGTSDNDGAFDLVVSKMRRGTEPPPHVHSREHEMFYILRGELNVYVDRKVFRVSAGEFIFLPRGVPHAFF